jgi:hypothetical protein
VPVDRNQHVKDIAGHETGLLAIWQWFQQGIVEAQADSLAYAPIIHVPLEAQDITHT